MSWTLETSKPAGASALQRILVQDTAYLVLFGSVLAAVSDLHVASDLYTELGRITVTPSGAKLVAIDHVLTILPGHSSPVSVADPRTAPYELQPRVGEHSEAIFLRHGDVVSSPQITGSFICTWNNSEVQVNSSTTGDGGVAETPEEETEEESGDEELHHTLTAVEATQSRFQPQATPQLSHQRSVVVQETPTAITRTNGLTEYPVPMDVGQPNFDGVIPENEPAVQEGESEPYSTARTRHSLTDGQEDVTAEAETASLESHTNSTKAKPGIMSHKTRHTRIMISKKRPSPPAVDESEPRKRAKNVVYSDDDTQDSRLSTIAVDTSPIAVPESKGRKRKSILTDVDEWETPSRSQRSQCSTSAATSDRYQGDIPRVATSNSAITEKGQAAKFLKKQGGSFIDSVKDPFNVLCVRDGDLHKTPKVLHAIATGTPIVTDKWLSDSAKAGHFLSTDAYQPSAPKKEKDWGFVLKDVLGQPQTPFEGYTVHFTTSLQSTYKPFTDIEQVCKAAGAKVTKKKIDKSKNDKVIILASEEGDKEAENLIQAGAVCYTRDIVPTSILRGALDLDSDEFKIIVGGPKEAKKTRGKKG